MASGHSHLTRFLANTNAIHTTGAGVAETSYYPAVSRLLEGIGATLSPKVRPIIHIRNQGSGIPDGGLFVQRPAGPVTASDPLSISAPERGVLEVKPPDKDIATVCGTAQIRRYAERYGKVVVTTLREWALVMIDPATGRARRIETYSIASTEAKYWALAAHPTDYEAVEFVAFLKRCLEHDAPLSNPADLAWLLAGHARVALARVEGRDAPVLKQLRRALADALGLSFDGAQGEHFFRSSLVQTLFYGVFSAWVLWHQSGPQSSERFQWRQAAWYLKVPFVSVLFERIATPSTLRPLGVDEVMDWTDDALARVDRNRFFARFEEAHAVQFFYEPFLHYFDSELRQQFGVWYTPTEVVDYMVDRADELLVSAFNIPKGLADDRVFVLDPCAGTGSYLALCTEQNQPALAR